MRISLDATERRALTLTVFAAACICFAPAEIISGVLLLGVTLALHRWDVRVTAREELARGVVAVPAPVEPRPEGDVRAP